MDCLLENKCGSCFVDLVYLAKIIFQMEAIHVGQLYLSGGRDSFGMEVPPFHPPQ